MLQSNKLRSLAALNRERLMVPPTDVHPGIVVVLGAGWGDGEEGAGIVFSIYCTSKDV